MEIELTTTDTGGFQPEDNETIRILLNESSMYRSFAMSLVGFVDVVPDVVMRNIRGSIEYLRFTLFVSLCVNRYPEDLIVEIRDELKATEALLSKMSK